MGRRKKEQPISQEQNVTAEQTSEQVKPQTEHTDIKSNEEELKKIISETAGTEGEVIGKGTSLEEQIAKEDQEQELSDEPKKETRGRKKGGKNKTKESEQSSESVDIITPAINGIVIPLVSKRLKRKAEDIMFTKEEAEMLAKLQPPAEFNKPSWPAYIITALSIIVVHVYKSDKIEDKIEEKAPQPSYHSRSNTPKENDAITTVIAEEI